MSDTTIKSTDRLALAAAGEALAKAGAPLRLPWESPDNGRMWSVSAVGFTFWAHATGDGLWTVSYVCIQVTSLLAAQHAAEAYAMAVVREQAAALGMAAVALPALAECERIRPLGNGMVWHDCEVRNFEPVLEYTSAEARELAAELLARAAEAERRAAGEARA